MPTPPTIPPRPARTTNSGAHMEVPKIPPRPNRAIDRSRSPHRDTFARSPLNDPTFLHNGPPRESSRLSMELPPRPPSVSMPSLGEEGNEYASFEDLSRTLTESQAQGSPQQTKNVAGDLPLHAPKAEVPSSTAKRNIAAVTRTDSTTAAAAGVGKPAHDDRAAQAKTHQSGSSIGSRPASLYNENDAHGIPEIGVQVPMFRNAGDVQAPTPSPFEQQSSSAGASLSTKPASRHHGRTKSGREIFHGPPGSYGMHGHGVISKDEFEQKWYEKHPEDLKREKAGEYGPHIQENRKDYHWRSDNLEKLVHARAQDAGMGTSREAVSTPDEQIGYMATEAYAMRMAAPWAASSARPASIDGGHADSPLRQGEQAAADTGAGQPDDNGNVYHIDPPAHRSSKIHGGGYDPPTADLGPEGGNTADEGGWVTERGYGIPILASDELKKRGSAEWRQPAVSPELERRGDEYTVNEDGTPAYVTRPRPPSRSSSQTRVQRVIPSPAQFDRGGTPLESHKEYEPLFPDDDEDSKKKLKPQADKTKRPTSARHYFPSQDVWEDTPGSLQLETTVETPQAPEEPETPVVPVSAAKVFEKPETEERRKEEITKDDQQSFLPEHTKRFAAANKHLTTVRNERPGMQQRFPSQDIWEDAPEHGRLETTVSAPQTDDTNEYAPESPIVDKPPVPPRPSIPARPQKKEFSPVEKKAPIIPDRPKPPIPARPTRPSVGSSEKVATLRSQGSSEKVSTLRSQGSSEKVATLRSQVENSSPQPKPKPPVPARPSGSKIAALQSGFMKDLNSKLGLGMQAPKVKAPEPKQEAPAQPLTDVRKGRAKGPQRRKPAASPVPAATTTAEVTVPRQKLDIGPVTAIWNFGEDGVLDVPAAKMAAMIQEAVKQPERVEEPVKKSEDVEEPVKKSEDVEEPVKKSEDVEESVTKPEHAEEPAKKSEDVEESVKKPEHVEESVKKPEHVEESVKKPEHVEESVTKPEHVEESVKEPEHVEESVTKPEHVEESVTKPEHVEESATKPEHAEESVTKPEHVEESVKKPEHAEEPPKKSFFESAAARVANVVSEGVELAKSVAKGSEVAPAPESKEPVAPNTAAGSVDAPDAISKDVELASTLKPEEPVATNTAAGSVDAPGAISKDASTLEPEKPHVTQTASSSVDVSSATSKGSEVAPEPEPKEPVATNTAIGSVDAPGAISKDAELASTHKPEEPHVTQTASSSVDAPSAVSKSEELASTLKPEEPVATNTTTGSVDAPGAISKDGELASAPESEKPLVTQTALGSVDAPSAVSKSEELASASEPEKPLVTQTASSSVDAPSAVSKSEEHASILKPDEHASILKPDEHASILKPEEPLVTQKASGSVDAPGAFPGSGIDDNATAGVSLEVKPGTEQSVKLEDADLLEKKPEPSTAAAAAPTTDTTATTVKENAA